ncbi:conserved hypothetical protein [Alteromonas sp. 38]|uniref:BadF/BadG/BcrA/BcrD ATPase family protein n=1 Tax=Alteromonas TaxID=226 RepID=UPI0012EF4876|nr:MULTISPECIES: BadF/BadG/BcrA/BcrD ATPase family protein [Alteromonas]CAD5263081.1 conserved hypothetical protein [Alteromonas sp. 154]VXC21201.1 conserved hypothetical protein [Alteromonas sp. 38]
MKRKFFLGIDGGGTKCKARLESFDGELLGEGLSGPCNPAQSADTALSSIIDVTNQALTSANLPLPTISELDVCLGLAGVNIPVYRNLVENWPLPFLSTHITTDLHIACMGAHAGKEGAIIISGTGSSALANVNGELSSIGGHGFPLGDKAGGAWLGWRALSYTLEALDALQPKTPLVDLVCEALNTNSAQEIVGQALHYTSNEYGKLAPIVVQLAKEKEPAAVSIVEEGKHYLMSVISRLDTLGAKRISMIGGLASHWCEWFPEATLQRLSPVMCSPEYGAVAVVKQIMKDL